MICLHCGEGQKPQFIWREQKRVSHLQVEGRRGEEAIATITFEQLLHIEKRLPNCKNVNSQLCLQLQRITSNWLFNPVIFGARSVDLLAPVCFRFSLEFEDQFKSTTTNCPDQIRPDSLLPLRRFLLRTYVSTYVHLSMIGWAQLNESWWDLKRKCFKVRPSSLIQLSNKIRHDFKNVYNCSTVPWKRFRS